MAKKVAVEPKPAPPASDEKFIDLMILASDFVQSCGGLDQAKKALEDAGTFISKAGGTDSAKKALEVLETLKSRI